MKGSDRRERFFDTAESETLGMWGSSMRGNREALQTPTLHSTVGRSKKPKGRNVDMHVCGESDGLIVPTKRANKAGAEALAAESAEGRRATKGNAPQAHSCRSVGQIPPNNYIGSAPDGGVEVTRGVALECTDP